MGTDRTCLRHVWDGRRASCSMDALGGGLLAVFAGEIPRLAVHTSGGIVHGGVGAPRRAAVASYWRHALRSHHRQWHRHRLVDQPWAAHFGNDNGHRWSAGPPRALLRDASTSLFFFRLDLHSRFPYYAWQPSHTTGSVAMARRRRRGAALTGGGCIGRPPPPCFPPGETCARTGARRQTRKREKSVPRTCPRRRASHLDFLPATQRSHDCTQPHCKPKRR